MPDVLPTGEYRALSEESTLHKPARDASGPVEVVTGAEGRSSHRGDRGATAGLHPRGCPRLAAACDRFVGATRQPDGALLVNLSDATIDGGRPSEVVALADGSWLPASGPKKPPYSVVAQRWLTDALGTDAIAITGPYTFAEGRTGLTLEPLPAQPDNRLTSRAPGLDGVKQHADISGSESRYWASELATRALRSGMFAGRKMSSGLSRGYAPRAGLLRELGEIPLVRRPGQASLPRAARRNSWRSFPVRHRLTIARP
jgi:hypothetical protein